MFIFRYLGNNLARFSFLGLFLLVGVLSACSDTSSDTSSGTSSSGTNGGMTDNTSNSGDNSMTTTPPNPVDPVNPVNDGLLSLDDIKAEILGAADGTPLSAPTGNLRTSGVEYFADVSTSEGDFSIRFFDDEAPKTVENFIRLAEADFYDGIVFHRVLPNFVVQGGDPTGTGAGGPGYTFEDELSPLRRHNLIGMVSMANSGFGTNGSQFFITLSNTSTHLDGYDAEGNLKDCADPRVSCHAVFGQVVEGLATVLSIGAVQYPPADPSVTASPVVIEDVTIRAANVAS